MICDDCGEEIATTVRGLQYCDSCLFDYIRENNIDPIQGVYQPSSRLPIPDMDYGMELEADWDNEGYVNKNDLSYVMKETPMGIVEDGSLSDGFEFITPKLKGEDGLNVIAQFLKRPYALTNRCGFHLHLSMKDYTWKDLLKIGKAYQILEPAIYDMLPRSRRNNNYCAPIDSLVERFKGAKTQDKFLDNLYNLDGETNKDIKEQIQREKNHDIRYGGVNFHSYYYRKTLEIRYHSGTFSYEKITRWLYLHQQVILEATHAKSRLLKEKMSPWDAMAQVLRQDPETFKYCRARREYFVKKEG